MQVNISFISSDKNGFMVQLILVVVMIMTIRLFIYSNMHLRIIHNNNITIKFDFMKDPRMMNGEVFFSYFLYTLFIFWTSF